MELFNYKNIKKDSFFLSKPFPNIELTNLWNNDLLEKCFDEIEKCFPTIPVPANKSANVISLVRYGFIIFSKKSSINLYR